MKKIIMYNSNGTVIDDFIKQCKEHVEVIRPGMYEDIKADKAKFMPEFLYIADKVIAEGNYNPKPINGFETVVKNQELESGLISNASEFFLKRAYEINGLDEHITAIYALFDPENMSLQKKDKSKLVDIFNRELTNNREIIGYVSHKEAEAVLGRDVYGIGILVNPEITEHCITEKEGKRIIEVQNLALIPHLIGDDQ
jgi:hypothetical protein